MTIAAKKPRGDDRSNGANPARGADPSRGGNPSRARTAARAGVVAEISARRLADIRAERHQKLRDTNRRKTASAAAAKAPPRKVG